MPPPSFRQVDTPYGSLVGRRLVEGEPAAADAFYGIPFARPPIGELRFQKPQRAEPWQGVRAATEWGPRSIQGDHPLFDHWQTIPCSEDCLYLNVFAPATRPEKALPVFFFIHGGAYSAGTAQSYGDVGICESLVSRGVVVVTVQYRVGYLGFFSTGDAACPGNFALWDLKAALEWVHECIGCFGGDTQNITVAGHSAGGAAADFLRLSPATNKLFHKVILMAGCASAYWSVHKRASELCRKKAELLLEPEECPVDSQLLMKRLRQVPAAHFSRDVFEPERNPAKWEVTPVIDGDFLPAPVAELAKAAPPMPCLVGVTKLEGTFFVLAMKAEVERLRRWIQGMLPRKCEKLEERTDEMLSHYLSDVERQDAEAIRKAFAVGFSDYSFNVPSYETMLSMLANDSSVPVFNYRFDYCGPNTFGKLDSFVPWKEASHGTELKYLFAHSLINPTTMEENEKALLDMMAGAFCNFCKNCDPNCDGKDGTSPLPLHWPAVTLEAPEMHLIFDLEPRISDCYFDGRPRRYVEVHAEEADKKKEEATAIKSNKL